jgi:glutamine synthetase
VAEASFAERAGVDDHARQAAAAEVVAACAGDDVTSVRLSFVDQHGLLRGKTFAAAQASALLRDGAGATGSLLAKDTGNRFAFPLWTPSASATLSGLVGAKDVTMLPDPATFTRLPWTDGAAWMLCDLYTAGAEPVVLSTRRLLREALGRLEAATGLRLRAGIELELHLYRRSAAGGPPEPVHPGWDLLAEGHADLVEPHLEPMRAALTAIGHEPRSIEIELGPGQVELTFDACEGLAAADRAVLVRSAIRQVARRHGLHATFMSRPGIGDAFPSGWHLHQSLVDAEGANAFAADDGGRWLSVVGEGWLAGLLAHAEASCLLTTPTVTGYKRYRPNSVAPDRITWSVEHRGAMLRLIGGRGAPGTHVENRVGDPAANPYLYLASQVVSGLDGVESARPLGPPDDAPYDAGAGPRLPRSLPEAIVAFEGSPLYRRAFGDEVVDYFVTLARSSWDRFAAHVTDWEQREYFELF